MIAQARKPVAGMHLVYYLNYPGGCVLACILQRGPRSLNYPTPWAIIVNL